MIIDNNYRIRVYVPNMPARKDRRESIVSQFEGKSNFDLTILTPVPAPEGHTSLWMTFLEVVKKEKDLNSPFFVFCEDDHVFTEDYNFQYLGKNIIEANTMKADVLSGGVSWLKDSLQVRDNLFWVDKFNGMQFTVVYNRFYDKILSTAQEGYDHITDFYLSTLSDSIFVMFPYISIQKEFGYSDVTSSNKVVGHVDSLFLGTRNRLKLLNKVKKYYLNAR